MVCMYLFSVGIFLKQCAFFDCFITYLSFIMSDGESKTASGSNGCNSNKVLTSTSTSTSTSTPVDTQPVTLISQQGDRFTITMQDALQSGFAALAFEDDDDDDDNELPVPNIVSSIMVKVIEFMKHRSANGPMRTIPHPVTSTDMTHMVSKWDAAFIDTDPDTRMELILAANMLDMPDLLSLGAAKVATLVPAMSDDELRQLFQITVDTTTTTTATETATETETAIDVATPMDMTE
jgi:hypothetical protein